VHNSVARISGHEQDPQLGVPALGLFRQRSVRLAP
jgi:hypothetical protein